MRISDWSSDVCSSDLAEEQLAELEGRTVRMQELQKVPGPDLVRRREQQTVLARDVGILIGFRPARVGRRDVIGRRHALVGRPRNIDVGRVPAIARWRLVDQRSEEHTSELQSLMRISYAVLC